MIALFPSGPGTGTARRSPVPGEQRAGDPARRAARCAEGGDPVDRSDEAGTKLGRRQFLQGLAAAGAFAGVGGLAAGCGGSSSPAAGSSSSASAAKRRGGNLKVGLTGGSGSDTLDPHNGLTYLDTARAQSLYQPLLQLNTAAQTEFVLAEEISPHGSTSEWVIRLRPGITFHDGKPLTADDVIFTLTRIVKGKFTGSTSLGPVDVKGLKAMDKHTVLVPMTSPYGSFVDQLAYWYYLYIVPVGFNPKQPNGTGPFKYQSFTPGQRSVFTKNPHYWKSGLPYVDTRDDHRLQRQRKPAERAGDWRHPRRRRARGPADRRAEKHRRRAHRRFAHRRDHAVHHARGPGTLQRRQRPPGHAAAGRPAAADQFSAQRQRGCRLGRLLALRSELRRVPAPGGRHSAGEVPAEEGRAGEPHGSARRLPPWPPAPSRWPRCCSSRPRRPASRST